MGEFDINQPVDSSAEEVVSAIHALRKKKEGGSERIGLWGVSRAGWIAPLVIKQEPSVKFLISVSGRMRSKIGDIYFGRAWSWVDIHTPK